MDIKAYNNHCLAQEEVTKTFPFDEKTFVDNGKKLTLADIATFESIHLKSHPVTAIQPREAYAAPLSGHHMHKKHWNTVRADGRLPSARLCMDRW